MENLLTFYMGMEVYVSRKEGQAVNGELKSYDNHGLVLLGITSDEEESEQGVLIYIPHHQVTMIHALENDNKEHTFVFEKDGDE